jgi:predicted lactoylglutathione lyase
MPMDLPTARVTLITLGVADLARSVRFYETLGFVRKVTATGDEVAFMDAGNVALSLWWWDKAADDAAMPVDPRPLAFRGITLAWNCSAMQEVDAVIKAAVSAGGLLLKPALKADWGGYSGHFADPDGHAWEVAHNPGFPFDESGRLVLPD